MIGYLFVFKYPIIKPVRTEAQENVVMRFGNNLIDTTKVMALIADRLRLKDTAVRHEWLMVLLYN